MTVDSDSVDFANGVDDEEGTPIVSRSLADRIRSQLAARKSRVLVFTHPDCPEWTVTYRLPLDRSELAPFFDRAEKAAKRKQKYSFDAAVLATFNVALANMGEDITDDVGTALTVRDRAVMQLLEALSPSEAIRTLYGSDGIVAAVAEKLLSEAGYGTGEDVLVDDVEDPTSAG
jgi:hypothetical protein